jgi:hypothetical protein
MSRPETLAALSSFEYNSEYRNQLCTLVDSMARKQQGGQSLWLSSSRQQLRCEVFSSKIYSYDCWQKMAGLDLK